MTNKNDSSLLLLGRPQGSQERADRLSQHSPSLPRGPQEKAQIICSYTFKQTHTLNPVETARGTCSKMDIAEERRKQAPQPSESQVLLPLMHTEPVFTGKHNHLTGVMTKLLYTELNSHKNTPPNPAGPHQILATSPSSYV